LQGNEEIQVARCLFKQKRKLDEMLVFKNLPQEMSLVSFHGTSTLNTHI